MDEENEPWTRAVGATEYTSHGVTNGTEEHNRAVERKGYEFLEIVRKGIEVLTAKNSDTVLAKVGDKWLVYSPHGLPVQPLVYETEAEATADFYEREKQLEELARRAKIANDITKA